jgi:hypothetical protein
MNTSFDRLNIVNTYGAFGTVGRKRYEVVIAGTNALHPTDSSDWREYEFKCKPGDVMRRPCVVSPYHYRLDWQIWFAAMSDISRQPWLVHFVYQLLEGDQGALSLLATDPFPDGPPRFIRANLYEYHFTDWDDPSGAWWTRHFVRRYLPPLSKDDARLQEFMKRRGWL